MQQQRELQIIFENLEEKGRKYDKLDFQNGPLRRNTVGIRAFFSVLLLLIFEQKLPVLPCLNKFWAKFVVSCV